MIRHGDGNLLNADVDALVNTVNTVGVMGKGVALQFKRAYPQMFKAYAAACNRGEVLPGRVHVYDTARIEGPRYIINFPTKRHWRSRSRIKDIEAGLDDLVRVVRELGINSVAVPPLGCGNGGLDWRDVRPLIERKLDVLGDVDVVLFAPGNRPDASDMVIGDDRPAMTASKATLVRLLAEYRRLTLDAASLIEIQKLMYFLQIAGEPLRLQFQRHHYGPYADNLRQVLTRVEGHFLQGYGDGDAPVDSAEPVRVLEGVEAEAVAALSDVSQERIDRVMRLAEGFDTPYGLELLATVHWLATRDGLSGPDVVTKAVGNWSDRKRWMFTDEHVHLAWDHLDSEGWLDTRVPLPTG